METKIEKDLNEVAANVKTEDDPSKVIFLGLDLGTKQTAIASSSGLKLNIESVVGWPKDFIAYNVVKQPIVIGAECLKLRSSLDIIYPLEKGIIKYGNTELTKGPPESREAKAVVELLKYLLGSVEKKPNQKIYAVVGTPAKAGMADKQILMDAARGLIDSILVVSEPFLVAYSLGVFGFAIIVDIGAGTTDTCRMHGVIPDANDQITDYIAGNEIDQKFCELLKYKYKGIYMDLNLARKIKEEHAFVGRGSGKLELNFYIHGKLTTLDVADELREACSIILPDICDHIRDLVVSYDPEFKPELLQNIILAGGGSRIRGLAQEIKAGLTDLGTLSITAVDDPFFVGAYGGLKLAQEIPFSEWKPL